MMLLDDLKQHIANKNAVLFIGTGFSISASNCNPVASWQGLLKNGVDRCLALCSNLRPGWKDHMLAAIDSSDMVELLGVAEQIESRLKALGGQYNLWLQETVGSLKLEKRELVDSIKTLNLPIVTTNYDNLLEQGLGLREIVWTDHFQIDRFLRGDEDGIFHLHGHWHNANSIILGIKNYQSIISSHLTQHFLKTLRLSKTLIFIGFGAGLQDPNFKAFLDYGSSTLFNSGYRHYRLIKQDELSSFPSFHPDGSGIYPIVYGSSHDDLVPFLHSLNP